MRFFPKECQPLVERMLAEIATRQGVFEATPVGNIAKLCAKTEETHMLPRFTTSKLMSDYLNRSILPAIPQDVRDEPPEWEIVHILLRHNVASKGVRVPNVFNGDFPEVEQILIEEGKSFSQNQSKISLIYPRRLRWMAYIPVSCGVLEFSVLINFEGEAYLESDVSLQNEESEKKGHLMLENAFLENGSKLAKSPEDLTKMVRVRMQWFKAILDFLEKA